MKSYRDNLEIDIKDLLLYVFKRWKILIIATLTGAIIGGGYSIITVNNQDNVNNQESQRIEELKAKLTLKELSDVDLAYKAHCECEKLYNEIENDPDLSIENKIELIKATNSLVIMNSSFSADQKAYYSALFNDENETKEEGTFYDSKISSATDESVTISLKKIVIGAFGGAFLLALILSFVYVFTPVLKTGDEIRDAFKLPIISSIRSEDNSYAHVYSCLLACIKKEEVGNVCIISASNSEATKKSMTTISDMFINGSASVTTCNSILSDSKVLDTVIESDGVVLFEQIGISRYENIAREIELCDNFGIKIIGVVVIK